MAIEKTLAKHLRKLNRAIQKMVGRSKDFAEFRKFLREEKVELAIYVVPIIDGKPTGEELRYELTDMDRQFLKQAGITF
ncbi:MAG: hypothetical protein HY737_03290 [Candidatus Omnitrophica bacterium]|nr:hypothetical protein [Candidatus Omnitrophota bacterium]